MYSAASSPTANRIFGIIFTYTIHIQSIFSPFNACKYELVSFFVGSQDDIPRMIPSGAIFMVFRRKWQMLFYKTTILWIVIVGE